MLSEWRPQKEYFSHPSFPGCVVDCSTSLRLVRVVTYSLNFEREIGAVIFRSSSLVEALRFVEQNFYPVLTEQIKLNLKASSSFRSIVGLALASGVAVWSNNKSDRTLKAYFLLPDQRRSFIKKATGKGIPAFPNDAQYYSVGGCAYSAIVHY